MSGIYKILSWLHFCLDCYYHVYHHLIHLCNNCTNYLSCLYHAKGIFFLLLLLPPATVILPLTTIYTSVNSHRSDLSTDGLNLISLLGLYLSSSLPDWSWNSIHFLVINPGTSLRFVPNQFGIFWYSVFKWCQNNLSSSTICCLFSGGM